MNNQTNLISDVTRRDIFDSLSLNNTNWAGRLEEPDFLARIFNLKEMPSDDVRFRNAYSDIWQHRVNNPQDWPDDWVFTDIRFNLLFCEDELFLRFLSEIIHPAVRSDAEEASAICSDLNYHLENDGFRLIESKQLAGRPVYSWERIDKAYNVALSSAKNNLCSVDTAYISKQISRIEESINTDPDLAIGTSKELVETVCKTILDKRDKAYSQNESVTKLVRLAAESLALVPEGVPDEAKASQSIKGILKSLSTITQGMMEIRNAYGTGHGKSAGHKGLTARHAKLVVGAASTLAVFLWETHNAK